MIKKLPAYQTAESQCFPHLQDSTEHPCWIRKETLNRAMMDAATADRDEEAEEHAMHGSQYKMDVPTADFKDDRQLFVQMRTQLVMDCGLCLAEHEKQAGTPQYVPTMPGPKYANEPYRPESHTPMDCIEEDVRMFCLEKTFSGHFFRHSPAFKTAETVCYPYFDLAGSSCQIESQELNDAYSDASRAVGGNRRTQYLELRERLVKRCDVCLGDRVEGYTAFHDAPIADLIREENAGPESDSQEEEEEPAAPVLTPREQWGQKMQQTLPRGWNGVEGPGTIAIGLEKARAEEAKKAQAAQQQKMRAEEEWQQKERAQHAEKRKKFKASQQWSLDEDASNPGSSQRLRAKRNTQKERAANEVVIGGNDEEDDDDNSAAEGADPVDYEVVSYVKRIVARPYIQSFSGRWGNPESSLEACEKFCRASKGCKFGTYMMKSENSEPKCYVSQHAEGPGYVSGGANHWDVDSFPSCGAPCVSFIRETEAQNIFIHHKKGHKKGHKGKH